MAGKRGGSYLVTGDLSDPFLPKLLSALNEASEIDLAVAFVKSTGLTLIYEALRDAMLSGVRIRILTGDYLCVTDPEALRKLLILQEGGANVRVFNSAGKSFHMKAYIFVDKTTAIGGGHAFVGSSNISHSALKHGLEWNVRIEESENPVHFRELRDKFELLFHMPQCLPLTNEWIDGYDERVSSNRVEFAQEPGADETMVPPVPNTAQKQALKLLAETREAGNRAGLVVLATGMGKTWLAAFDSRAINAKRLLFVAHREEILDQAEETFVRIRPKSSVGKYTGKDRELNADMVFASIQTLGQTRHLELFPRDYFDYIVVDEFHHAAAITYRRLLAHFMPRFLLGLTATPERTDQSDILTLCGDNLVVRLDLFEGVSRELLCPFRYYGIGDEAVDYTKIPWRSGRFDPKELGNALATNMRARHVLRIWKDRKLSRTLAFCASQRHAEYMCEYFERNGVEAVAVHSNSTVRRSAALDMLRDGEIEIIFSVDLFNEGVDVPCIDTVLMIRPTDSKIVFLQQLGRGLRLSPETGKRHLVVLDFIGNHISFFRKVEALFQQGGTNQERRSFLDDVKNDRVSLPDGCYVNYDLQAIEILESLTETRIDSQIEIYQSLLVSLGRRPSISEFYRADGSLRTVRHEFGGWFRFLQEQGDLSKEEDLCIEEYGEVLDGLELFKVRSEFTLVLLESFLEGDGLSTPLPTDELARRSYEIITARTTLNSYLLDKFRVANNEYQRVAESWHDFWMKTICADWLAQSKEKQLSWFVLNNGNVLTWKATIAAELREPLTNMLFELCDYKYGQYAMRADNVLVQERTISEELVEVPFFRDLKIACGHFTTSEHDESQLDYRALPTHYGNLDSKRHFIATARGNSMNGGKHPIRSGDLLLLELMSTNNAGSISNQVLAIERQDEFGDDQYLLRYVKKNGPNDYTLRAWNPDYEDMSATNDMRTFARLHSVLDPLEFNLHRPLMREDIPSLFGHEFNIGSWNLGHVNPKGSNEHVLLVTLNKTGQSKDHRYLDYFETESVFHWQSQNATAPTNKRGSSILKQKENGENFYLFVRKNKLHGKGAAPFYYCGSLQYREHTGSKPMNVTWDLDVPLSPQLAELFEVQSLGRSR